MEKLLILDHPNSVIEFNARDNYGETAFMYALQGGREDVVELLKSKSNLIEVWKSQKKSEACGQPEWLDRSVLIWQKLVENAKIKNSNATCFRENETFKVLKMKTFLKGLL